LINEAEDETNISKEEIYNEVYNIVNSLIEKIEYNDSEDEDFLKKFFFKESYILDQLEKQKESDLKYYHSKKYKKKYINIYNFLGFSL
jgi:hypothetical protein